MSKHSPGPWRIGQFQPFGLTWTPEEKDADPKSTDVIGSIWANDATDSRGASCVVSHMVDNPDMANVRLIAAAPEMLEALKAMDEYTHQEFKAGDFQSSGEKGADRFTREQIWKMVREAIAKAEGK